MSRAPESQRRSRHLSSGERVGVILVSLLLFLAFISIAGGDNAAALAVTFAYCASPPLLLLSKWGRLAVEPSVILVVLGLLFGLTIIVAALTLTPVHLDSPHLAWGMVAANSTPSLDHSRTSIEIVKLMGLSSIFITGLILGKSYSRAIYLLQTAALMGCIYGLWSFIAFIVAPSTFMGFGTSQWSNRLCATFSSANTAGTFFGTMLILCVGLLVIMPSQASRSVDRRSEIERKLSLSAGLIGIALIVSTALLLTGSRTAILTTTLVLLIFVLSESFYQRWRWQISALVLAPSATLAGFLLLLFSGASFFQRMTAVQFDAASRAQIYLINIQAAKPFPYFGLGLGSFELVHRQLIDTTHFGILWNIRAMHNVYLQWWQEAGALGSAPLFMSIILCLAFIGSRAVQRRATGTYLRIILAMSAIVLLHGSTDFALEEFSFAGFWTLLLGCGLAVSLSPQYKK